MNTKLKSSLSSVLIVTGLFFAITTTNAQNKKQQRQKPTAAEMAEKEMSKLKTGLALTADQEAKVKTIVQKYAEQKDAALTESQGDRTVAKTKIDAIETNKDTELKTVLTDEQYQQLQTQKSERKSRGSGGRGGHGGGGHHKKQN